MNHAKGEPRKHDHLIKIRYEKHEKYEHIEHIEKNKLIVKTSFSTFISFVPIFIRWPWFNFRRFWSVFVSRNKEFFRDKASFGWNFIFPFLVILGFALIFHRGVQPAYKCGVILPADAKAAHELLPESVTKISLFKFMEFQSRDLGFEKLKNYRLDILVEQGSHPLRYWINHDAPDGIVAESLLLNALHDPGDTADKAVRETVKTRRIDYLDWLFPGVIAMNMMFSSLYGVAYPIVRYRKIGVLKRLKVTPLTAFEYLAAQVLSRMFVILFSSIVVYAGCTLIFDFHCKGSYFDLLIFFTLGGASIISLALIIVARTASEELAYGILEIITWPMMFLSEVWFSIEGSSPGVRMFSQIFPLKHVTEGMRQIMNEGASLSDLGFEIAVLSLMTAVFMLIGSLLFKWTKD
jgi:ABC-2 type transport system permease protein